MQEKKWADVEKYCLEQIETLHRQLEGIQPETTTNQLRGEIRALRRVIAFGKPQAPEPPERTAIQPVSGYGP
jgi:hypothetical protein